MTYLDFVNQFVAMNPILKQFSDSAGISLEILVPLMIIIFTWQIIWKGFALWKAANKKHLIWFIILIVFVNTLGILDILYFYVFSKIDLNKNDKKDMKLIDNNQLDDKKKKSKK